MTASQFLAFDLGGTQLRASVVSANGEILSRAATTTDAVNGAEAVLKQFRSLAQELNYDSIKNQITAIGVSSPGPVDRDTGTILRIPTIKGLDNLPLRERLSSIFEKPVVLENDGIAAAFGEWKHGAGQGLANLIYITVSTGIGGGVISDGRVVHGRQGFAGHVGHMMIDPKGPRCNCGGTGCLETFAAGPAFAARAKLKGFASGAEVFADARNNNETAKILVQQEADYLAYGFASLIYLFSPQRIIVGGGMSAGLDLMLPRLTTQIKSLVMPEFGDVEITPAMLGGNSGLIGAAALASQRVT